MTAEHLLDAIGLLDDELIQEAERPVFRTRRAWKNWGAALAACLVLVVAIGYALTNLRMGAGGASGAASNSTAGTSDSSGASGGAVSQPQEGQPESAEGMIWLGDHVYQMTGVLLTALPADAVSLGQLSQLSPDSSVPGTDREDLVGRTLFQNAGGTAVYVQMNDGLWAEAHLVEP